MYHSMKGYLVALRSFVFVSILTLTMTATAGAADVFGNGDLGTSANLGGYSYAANDAWAVPFTTGNSSPEQRNLLGAWILAGGNTVSDLTVDVEIFADSVTNQGPTGSALATGSISVVSGSLKEWRFVTFSAPSTLDANSNFYVSVAASTGTTSFVWAIPNSMAYSNLGSGSDYSITTGGTQNIWKRVGSTWSDAAFSVDTAPFGFQLVSVPEPSTYALTVIATLAMGIVSRRRRRAA
ncbi:PEP-CTERM sorting domain-containing protein [bacterium]|nr:PEP-CTERM sorting domain-containing protein [bacterium]